MKFLIAAFLLLPIGMLWGQSDPFAKSRILFNQAIAHEYDAEWDSALVKWKEFLALPEGQVLDRERLIAITRIAGNYLRQSEYREGIAFLEARQSLFQPDLPYYRVLGDYWIILGTLYRNIGQIEAAIENLQKAKVFYEQTNDLSIYSYWVGQYMSLLRGNGEYYRAIEEGTNFLNIVKASGEEYPVSNLQMEMGALFSRISDFDKAHDYLKQAIAGLKEDSLRGYKYSELSNGYNSMGYNFRRQNRLDEALVYYDSALNVLRENGDTIKMALKLENIAEVYQLKGDIGKAKAFFNRALAIYSLNDDMGGIASVFMELAQIFLEEGEYEEARQRLDSAEAIVAMTERIEDKLQISKLNSAYYERLGQYQQALEYTQAAVALEDTLIGLGRERVVRDLEAKYQTASLTERVDYLAAESNRLVAETRFQKTLLYGITVGAGLLGVIVFVLYRANLYRKRAGERIENLMRESHHRIKNNFQTLSSMLSLQGASLADPVAKQAIKSGENRVQSMAYIHQKLYQSDRITDIDLHDYLQTLVENLATTFGYDPDDDRIGLRLEQISMDVDQAMLIGLIVNELVSNAFKYGFRQADSATARLDVSLTRQAEGLRLVVADKGPGLPEGFSIKSLSSFGMKMVHSLTRQLRGTLQMENREGTVFQITVPF